MSNDNAERLVTTVLKQKYHEKGLDAETNQLKTVFKTEVAEVAAKLRKDTSKDIQDLVEKAKDPKLSNHQRKLLNRAADFCVDSAERTTDFLFEESK